MNPAGQSPAATAQNPSAAGAYGVGWRRRVAARLAAAVLGAALPAVVLAQAQSAAPGSVAPAEAVGSGPLETTIVMEILQVEQAAGGKEIRRWVPATRLNAGDEVSYTVRVRNPGKEPVSDIIVTKRLPFGVRYQRGSATGPAAEVQFSADGGNTFGPPDQGKRTTQTSKQGKGTRKPPPPEYTHVRWILTRPLDPGATALLRFRATFS
jgi:uncharacterized repeat protein (TIGR01451 family)